MSTTTLKMCNVSSGISECGMVYSVLFVFYVNNLCNPVA